MAMTQEEKQEILSSLLSSVRTNSRTIGALTPVTSLSDTSYFEINGGKRVAFSVLKAIFTELIRQAVDESEKNILEAIGGISDFGGISDEGLSLILGIRRVADESGIREFDASVHGLSDLSTYADGTRAWVEDEQRFYEKDGTTVTLIDSYHVGQTPRGDLIFRFGNRLYCWRDGKLVEFIAGLNDDIAQLLDSYVTPVILLSHLDTLGTDGSAAAIRNVAIAHRGTRWKVVDGIVGKSPSIGYLDLLGDRYGHVVTEVFTTHHRLDDSGELSTTHEDGSLYVYYRSYNLNSPTLGNEQGSWSAWKLLNGDEVHLDPSTGQINREDMPPAVIPFSGTLGVTAYEQKHLMEAPAGSKVYYDEARESFFLQTGSALETKYYRTWGGNPEAGILSSEEMGPWASSLYLTGTELWGMVEGKLQKLLGGVIWEPSEGEGDHWQLGPLANQVEDTGLYDESRVYRCKYSATAGGVTVTHDCWYLGCRYRCKVDGTVGVAPCYGSPNWEFISGDPTFTADFEEKTLFVNMSRLESWEASLTLVATMYNQSVLSSIPSGNIVWRRESYDSEGNRRTASDASWTPDTTDGNKRLRLSKADLDYDGTTISRMVFSATVTLGSHSETVGAQLTQMLLASGNLGSYGQGDLGGYVG